MAVVTSTARRSVSRCARLLLAVAPVSGLAGCGGRAAPVAQESAVLSGDTRTVHIDLPELPLTVDVPSELDDPREDSRPTGDCPLPDARRPVEVASPLDEA